MKYPASPMMGGRRNKKNMSGVNVLGKASSSLTKKKNKPMRMPMIIKMLDSGKYLLIHEALWKPKISCLYLLFKVYVLVLGIAPKLKSFKSSPFCVIAKTQFIFPPLRIKNIL